jgi:hypothetical protein
VKGRLAKDPHVYLQDTAQGLIVNRLSRLPRKGFFRFIIPRTRALVRFAQQQASYKIVLDPLALLFLLVCAGGIVVELTMPRARHPPVLPYVMLAAFSFLAIVDAWRMSKLMRGHVQP